MANGGLKMNSFGEWEAEYQKYVGNYLCEPTKARDWNNWQFNVNFTQGFPAANMVSRLDKIVRTPVDVRRDDTENFYLCYLRTGSIGVRHFGQEELIKPGSFYLGSSTKPFEMVFDEAESDGTLISVPHNLFSCERNRFPAAGSQIDANNPLHASLTNLINDSAAADPASTRSDMFVDLLGMAFSLDCQEPSLGRIRNAQDQVHFITRAIDRHLTASSFSIDSLAKIVGRSRRQLQRDLAKAGTTFTRLLQDRRLRYFVAVGSRDKRLTQNIFISDLAYRCGFNDISHFNRLFREKFDASPTEYFAEQT